MKFLHTMGAIGLMGSMACLLVLLGFMPKPASLSEYARLRAAMGGIAQWIFLPSLALTLIAGLAAIALNRSYHNAGWAWAKLMTGVLIFEFGFSAVQGPMENEAALSATALAGDADAAAMLGQMLDAEWNSLGCCLRSRWRMSCSAFGGPACSQTNRGSHRSLAGSRWREPRFPGQGLQQQFCASGPLIVTKTCHSNLGSYASQDAGGCPAKRG